MAYRSQWRKTIQTACLNPVRPVLCCRFLFLRQTSSSTSADHIFLDISFPDVFLVSLFPCGLINTHREFYVFIHPVTDIGASEALCFRVVRPWMRASVRLGVRPVSTISYKWMEEFQQILKDDVAEDTHGLVIFWRSTDQGQGLFEVIYLNEILLRAEEYT